MEYKGKVTHIPPVAFIEDPYLRVDTTFSLTANRDLRGEDFSPMAMLQQEVHRSVPGTGSMVADDYGLTVTLGSLFDVDSSVQALQKAFDLVVGRSAWLSATYDHGVLIFKFSQVMWQIAGQVNVHDLDEDRSDIQYTAAGLLVAKACNKAGGNNGISLRSPRAIGVNIAETELPQVYAELWQQLCDLLPRSNDTIQWQNTDSEPHGDIIDAIPPR